jgi:hypothetical protein
MPPRDGLTNYRWGRFVGGEHDGQEVPPRSWGEREVTYGDDEGETYVRRKHTFGPNRVICFVNRDKPGTEFWPYTAMEAIFSSHPDLTKTTYEETTKT